MCAAPNETPLLGASDAALLTEIDNLQLTARRVATGALAGVHRSLRRGSSIEFSEHKVYTPGDDIRHIDWHAYAKTDRFHVKQFEDETNLRLEILIDHSGSMEFSSEGLPSKLDYARTLASALTYLALRQGDATGLVTFSAEITDQLPPRASSTHLLEVFSRLVALRPSGPTGLSRCIDHFARTRRRRCVAIIITDLFDPSPDLTAVFKRMVAQRHDVAVLHVLDPAEVDFPYDNPSTFHCMEDERKLFLHPRTFRNRYVLEMQKFLDETARNMVASGIDYRLIKTSADPAHALGAFLRERASRSR